MSHPPATFTLAGLPSFDHCVHHERSLRDVFALLESNSRIPGVMVFSGRRLVTVLSRSRLHNTTRRYSTVETFTPESPLSRLVANWPVKPTLLNADTSVEEATAIALSRGEESLAEPLVCVDARGRQTLIDIHTLMAAQCHQLALSNQRLAEASRSCELASKAKTDFLANMSHEIRTPMTAILGYAELLQDPGVDEAQRASAARTIRRSGEHLLNLLNDILDVSKVESGRLELERLDHDPVSLIREVVDLLRPRAHEKGVQLVLDVSSDTPAQVHTDPTRLRQIVSNLVGNAIKFTHSGQVRVTVNIDRSLGTDPRQRAALCSRRRHRHRHHKREHRQPVPAIRAGRCDNVEAIRWFGARPHHQPQTRPAARRRHHSDQLAGQRLAVRRYRQRGTRESFRSRAVQGRTNHHLR